MTENKGDLISREALINVILNDCKLDGVNANWEVNRILVHIKNAPTVEISQEQAIDKLNEIGWLYNHDKAIAEFERPQGDITEEDIQNAIRAGYENGYSMAQAKYQRPQGEWIEQFGKSYELITDEGTLIGEFTKCPKCLYDKARGSNFCPNCGADMRGDKK